MGRDHSGRSFSWANLARLREVAICRSETKQWLPITLAYLRLRQLQFPYELVLRRGQRMVLHERTDLVIFWLVFARRHYPVRATDRIIVDVGANVGIFTLYAAREAPWARIVAIEPFPSTRERLMELVESNGIEHTVAILDCALAGSSGTGAMDEAAGIPSQYRRIYSDTTKTLNLAHRGSAGLAQSESGIPVRKVTMEEMLDEANIASADLVKMNIHGNEYEVLLSTPAAVLTRCTRIALQYHEMPAEANLGKCDIFEHMGKAGFEVAVDEDTGRGVGRAILQLKLPPR
jgi:FkbM family methyltransferase